MASHAMWLNSQCHSISKTNVQYQLRLLNHGTLGHAMAQWATILNNGIPIDIQVNNNDYQLQVS